MGDSSKITTDIAVDDAIQLDANYRLDRHDRRYIDNQILGCEEHLVDSLLSGYTATWGVLDGSSTSVNIGDVLCVKHTGVTKATTAALANAGAACGVVVIPASPGTKVRFAIGGVLPAKYSGIGAGLAQPVRVNSTTGALERVASYLTSDYPIGIADVDGNITLDIGAVPASVTAGSMFVPSGTGFVHITSGTEDAAARAINLNSSDVTNVLQVTKGGTGLSSIGTSLQVLRTNSGATALEWATLSIPSFPLSVANGGTGLTALGSALQYLRTNASATAMEWATLPSGAAVSGSGLWHSSSGTLDAAASIGTANQVMVTNSGATDTVWALIVDANVSATAAIAGTKISPNFGSQLVQTTGNIRATALELTSGGPTITEGTGVPGTTPPDGSLFLRTDGTASTTAYVRSSGTWTALNAGGGGTPAGPVNSLQYDNSGSFGGASEFTYVSGKLNVAATSAITFGASPASVGSLRLSNSEAIAFRNFSGGADIIGLQVDSSNAAFYGGGSGLVSQATNTYLQATTQINLVIGAAAPFQLSSSTASFSSAIIALGSGVVLHGSTVAGSGDFRVKNGYTFTGKNVGGTGDITIFNLDGSNFLGIGGTTGSANQATITYLQATSNVRSLIGSTTILDVTGSTTSFSGSAFAFGAGVITHGSSVAGTGDFRVKNAYLFNALKAGGGDATLFNFDSSNILSFGGDTSLAHQVPNVYIQASTEIDLFYGSTAIFTIGNGLASVRNGQNLSVGDFTASLSSATNTIYIKDGTQPTGAPSTGVYISSDSGRLHFRSSFSSAGVPINIRFEEVSGGFGAIDPDHAIKMTIDKPGAAGSTRYLRFYQ